MSANTAGRLPASETVAIHLLAGAPLADGGAADLWDGSIDRPFNVTELGVTLAVGELVFTGTDSGGSNGINTLGDVQDVIQGITSAIDATWVVIGENGPVDPQRFYGISQVLTVPASIPEPASFTLLLAAGLGLRYPRNPRAH